MLKSSYEVEILINGKPAKEYYHNYKNYIEGREGTRFSIRMRNNSYSRKLFVPTIDGLSVMDGKEGSYDSSGYIIQPYSSITIDGWRTSDKEVASFYFSSPEGSYRKRMSKGNNLGVIGVAVFEEKYNFYTYTPCTFPTVTIPNVTSDPTWGPTSFSSNSTMNYDAKNLDLAYHNDKMYCCSSLGSSPQQKLGTGFGEVKRSEVTSISFERLSYPACVMEIYYNTRSELEKAGVSFKKEPLYVAPEAFPGNSGYCTPPKN